MIRLAAAASAVLAIGVQDSAPPPELPTAAVVFAQTVRQQVMIRVPRPRASAPAASAPMRWRETAGPKCIAADKIEGAFPSASSVDIVLNGNRRVRAQLGQTCAGLNYYRGVYVNANPDGRICAGRDVVRSRMGGQCEIVQFRILQPARP